MRKVAALLTGLMTAAGYLLAAENEETTTMLKEGSKAPPFTLESSDAKKVSLADLKGKKVVLYFYPKDNTPGCTREAQAFRDASAQLQRKNAVVLGVSKDSIESHCTFRDEQHLNFALLSDPSGEVIRAYGAWGEKNMYGKISEGILRTTVLIDEKGNVLRVFPKVKVDGHAEEVLAALGQ